MGKINILSPNVYNRIAAGEVVDRPYSVVKELVENAIDAGATEIEIRIENGGKTYVSVCDNGCGIEYSDLKSVFLSHATSKLKTEADLSAILTLGFRGEAVASIASVSHVRYTSKCADAECYTIACNGGEIGNPERCSGNDGTLVEVSDLFYNVPVRAEFMRSDRVEEGEITTYVQRFMLSNPYISFRYYVNDKLVLQSLGEGEDETLVSVYGANILANTYHIDAEKHGIHVHGYISNQNYFKPNRSCQNIFINGRYIVNATISAAMSNAYSNYAMKRQYPFYVLHIDMPAEIVDVNVHPNKTDVRFVDNQVVYGCIYSIISAILDGSSKALDYIVSDPLPVYTPTPVPEQKEREEVQNPAPVAEPKIPYTYEQAKRDIEEALPKPDLTEKRKTADFAGALPFEEVEKKKGKSNKKGNKLFSDLYFIENTMALGKTDEEIYAKNKLLLLEQEEKLRQQRMNVDACVYKGNFFQTYLIYELGDEAYIIDQHAAHERLIFDRLKRKMEERNVVSQPMLVPFEMHVSPVEDCILSEYVPYIQEMGFDIRELGCGNYSVSAVPLDLQDISLDEFFRYVLSDTMGLRKIRLVDILKERLATCACKAAIKGGKELTLEEVKTLLRDLNGDMGLKCPHGRPAVVRLTKSEIEKLFKRIV